jgi:hypothetical protein
MIKRKLLSMTLAVVMIASLFTFGAMTVSANPDLEWSGELVEWCAITETFTANNGPVLYALRYNPDSHERARWIPLIGTLDASRIIPRRNTQLDRQGAVNARYRPTLIAFKCASATLAATPTGLAGDDHLIDIIHLQGRDDLARNSIVWSGFANDGAGGLSYAYVDNSGTRPRFLAPTSTASITTLSLAPNAAHYVVMAGRAGTNGRAMANALTVTLEQWAFPMGATLEVRSVATMTDLGTADESTTATGDAWTRTRASDTDVTLRSATNPLRVRVPAMPRAPRAQAHRTNAASLTSLNRNTMEFALVEDFDNLTIEGLNNITWTNFETLLAPATAGGRDRTELNMRDLPNFDDYDYIIVRLRATQRNPASHIAVIELPGPTTP